MVRFIPMTADKIEKIKALRAGGMTVPQVALSMDISETTVRKYGREFPMRKSSRGRIYKEKHFTPAQIAVAVAVLAHKDRVRREALAVRGKV